MSRFIRPCQVCGGESATPLYANNMLPIEGLDMSYVLARCNGCGFHFACELPHETQYARYYETLSKYDSQPSVSFVDKLRIQAAVKFCEHLEIPKDARIIDLGCGFGAFLAHLHQAGWSNLQGIDPAPQSARQGREQFGLECIRQGSLAQIENSADLAQADLVCLMAVLEHLPELHRDLASIFRQMRPQARILVEVPALDLFSTDTGEPFGELSLEHIQFFSSQSLRNLFSRLGVRVLYEKWLSLPSLHSGALLVVAERFDPANDDLKVAVEDPRVMDSYLKGSENRWVQILRQVPHQPFVLYGAGSHSARLIPRLDEKQRQNMVAVLDGNPNLHGKNFGSWVVQPPHALKQYDQLPILVSSYRSEQLIASHLKQQFPDASVHCMYGHV